MTNGAWRKLCNEWMFNALNDTFVQMCAKYEVSSGEVCAMSTDKMVLVRKDCKRVGVWLEDTCEADLYVAIMPFGGYTPQALCELKQALATYRHDKSNKAYRDLMAKYDY